MAVLITCKEGCEKIASNEVVFYNGTIQAKGPGWILAEWTSIKTPQASPLEDPCFAHYLLENPIKISAASVNSLTEKLIDLFTSHIADQKITDPWPLLFSSSDDEQLIQRVKTVEKYWLEKIQKKMSRVAKLARKGLTQSPEWTEGFFIHFTALGEAFVSFKALSAGQQRMQMDPDAPSRSYLKIEEAFHIFGQEPDKNNTVADLGAAPGGWSFSALKRGAMVTAVDNGPLKGVVRTHPNITHLTADALSYQPAQPVDWLFCDMLELPEVILHLLDKWASRKWCRYFIVNIKVGRNDPILLLKKLRDPNKGLQSYCDILRIRQLYHDREEITLMGKLKD